MFLINLLHDLQVLLALAFRLVVVSCAAQSKNPTLLLDADLAFRGNQSFAGPANTKYGTAFDVIILSKSFSTESPYLRNIILLFRCIFSLYG